MRGIEGLFVDPSAHRLYIHSNDNFQLILVSTLIAIIFSTLALQTAHIAQSSSQRWHRQMIVISGAIALGGGIWTTYFITILALAPGTFIAYSLSQLILSILCSAIAGWTLMHALSCIPLTRKHLILASVFSGVGIGVLHYSSMTGTHSMGLLPGEPGFAVSLLFTSALLSFFALWAPLKLCHTRLSTRKQHLLSGLLIGLSIGTMHYLSIEFSRFYGISLTAKSALPFNPSLVALIPGTLSVALSLLIISANSMTRYRRLFQKMEASESHVRAIFNTALDGIITINSHGIVQDFNHSAERLFGWKANEVIGKNIKMLMPEPNQSQHDNYLKNYLTSGIPKIIGAAREVVALHKDGGHFHIRLAVGRMDVGKEPLFVGLLTDITDYRQLESSLRKAAEQARQAAAAKTTFLANMSHEIRTPMNAIIGFTEILLKSDLTPTQRSHLKTVHQSSRSLLRLLNDILDTTKLEKGSAALEILDFSLKEVATQVVASLSLTAEGKKLQVIFDYPEEMPQYFKGDPLRIQQILINLLGNAIKFTEKGYVKLSFSPSLTGVRIQVNDSGIGMTPKQMEHIFDPFMQADASISRRFGGTGLGTTIVRQWVELMGGTIRLESTLGQGSTFFIELPLPAGNKPDTVTPSTEPLTLSPLKMLIADDIPQNVELLTLILEERGHTVTAVRDGFEAIEKYQTDRFDVVLMDVHMPNLDGLEAVRRIRTYEQTHGRSLTPVIALTASVLDTDQQAVYEAGMNGFAIKPIDIPKLMTEIARVLNLPAFTSNTPASPPSFTSHKLIDWTAGIAVWGKASRLKNAIENFLRTAPLQHPLPNEDSRTIDWKTTLSSLHSIRGAAGNLALPQIAALAEKLEGQLRSDNDENIQSGCVEIQQLFHSVAHEIQADDTPDTQQSTPPPQQIPAHEIQNQIEKLITCLKHNELKDSALQVVSSYLKSQNHSALHLELHHALDTFDFDYAISLLEKIRKIDSSIDVHATV